MTEASCSVKPVIRELYSAWFWAEICAFDSKSKLMCSRLLILALSSAALGSFSSTLSFC